MIDDASSLRLRLLNNTPGTPSAIAVNMMTGRIIVGSKSCQHEQGPSTDATSVSSPSHLSCSLTVQKQQVDAILEASKMNLRSFDGCRRTIGGLGDAPEQEDVTCRLPSRCAGRSVGSSDSMVQLSQDACSRSDSAYPLRLSIRPFL